MKVVTDYSLNPYDSHNNTAALIEYLLSEIASALPVDYACVLSRAEDSGDLELLAEFGDSGGARDAVFHLLRSRLEVVSQTTPPEIAGETALEGTGFRSAILFSLAMPDSVIGMAAVFARSRDAYPVDDIPRVGVQLALVRTLLENNIMYSLMAQNMIVTQSIQIAAREIASNPSPQHAVDILRDYFFDAHVTSCALLLYGPLREDQPNGPFEFLEIKGTWSKRRGSGVGVGVRFYLHDLPDLVARLDEDKLLIFPRARDLVARLDPLLRAFLQAERVRSLTLIALNVSERKLGVLFVGADRQHDFTMQELRSYQTVSEFLAINVMTQMLQAQRESIEQARAALLEAVTDGVLMVFPSTDGARVLTVNNRFREMFDLGDVGLQSALLSEVLDQLPFPEPLRVELRKTWLDIPVRDPALHRSEFHMIHEDGHPMDVEWYSAPVYQESRVLGRIYIFHDVTADRTAQRLRSAFLSRISHELRTPLTSIRGFAEFILEASGPQLPDIAREYTEIILNSARHLNSVFTDMIEITRADAGELRLNREEARLPDIIIDVVARMELMYKGRKQQIIMELDDDLPPVSVDVDRMIQVLTNLLTNAIKYSPENSAIHIGTRAVMTADDLPDSAPSDVVLPAVLVTVADEGAGLSKEDAEKVFMPFYRTEAVRRNKVEGAGLGLAVTRSLVEMHRGKIWAEPKKRGRSGGLFLFTIPTIERGK